MIVIEVDKIQYGNFTAASASLRLDALSNTFGVDATSDSKRPLPFKGGEACLVFAAGEQILSGNIEVVSAFYSSNDHTVSLTGRDKTGDLLDSTLAPIPDLKVTTLKALCERVLKEIGLKISVIDEANPDPFNPAEDIESPDPAENAFMFLEKYARKRHVLLTSDFDGNLVITRSSGIETKGLIQNRKDNKNGSNNVVAGQVDFDTTGRFNLYKAVSQLNPTVSSLATRLNPGSVANSSSKAVLDERIRGGRQLILISEAMTAANSSFDRASWEKDMRNARGTLYSPELIGFTDQENDLWQINTLPQVDDEDAGIQERMLIDSVTFSSSMDFGNKTTLTLMEPDAFNLELSRPVSTDTKATSTGLEALKRRLATTS